jgi:hypothetical protein
VQLLFSCILPDYFTKRKEKEGLHSRGTQAELLMDNTMYKITIYYLISGRVCMLSNISSQLVFSDQEECPDPFELIQR